MLTDALIIDTNAVKLTRLEFEIRGSWVKVTVRLAPGGGFWVAEGEGLGDCSADTIGELMQHVQRRLGS